MNDLGARLTSRKFLLALAAVIYVLVQVAGGAISTAQGLDTIKFIVTAYMAAEGIADAAGRLKPNVPIDPSPTPAAAVVVP